jgi:hypothetical protein
VKKRCIDEAAAEGITLTIGGAQVGWGQVHLTDVAFKIDEVPQITGAASDVDVALSGLSPREVTGLNVGITIDGSADEVAAAVDKWRADHAKAPGRAAAAAAEQIKITMQNGHLGWTHAFGQLAKIDASNVTAQTDGNGTSFQLAAEKTIIGMPKGDLGPWRTTFERDASSVRTRIDLDPVVRDGPSALSVRTPGGGFSLKVSVPRSPLARIGVPPAVLGLAPGQTTQVEAQIDLERPTPQHAEMKSTVSLLGARLGGAPIPADVKLAIAAAGDPAKPLDVTRGTLQVGPFEASVTGTMQVFEDGARLALSWRAQPLKCEQIAENAAKEALGDLGASLNALGKQLGVAKVTGEARASGLLTVDSRNLNDVSFTITANDTCGIAILP